jgi:hypothetical protein
MSDTTAKEPRTIREIALEIARVWVDKAGASKVWFGAAPYLKAMRSVDGPDDPYGYGGENARTMVLYFLANAQTWKGADARRIKAELKDLCHIPGGFRASGGAR